MASERQAIERRRRELQQQLRALSGAPLMRGSIYQRRRRCGRPGCACAKDPQARHASTFLTVFLAGRTQGFHLRAEDEAWAEQAVATYNRLWKLVNALTACEVAELRRQIRERRRARQRRNRQT
jgi:RNA:NAD 2'-phosphotransferase (TPT1/KptA family)